MLRRKKKPPSLVRVLFWRLVPLALLGLALAIALRGGRTVDAIVIAVVMVPAIVLIVLLLIAAKRELIADDDEAD